mgnify:CR=1 FL=1
MTRMIHLSDLHFSYFTWSPLQFFSKRWIGNANLLLSRRTTFVPHALEDLPELFASLGVEKVLFTGDASTTGLKKELEKAAHFFEKISQKNIQVMALPGNHDHYTKKDYKRKTFYRYFPSKSLEENGVETLPLADGWNYVGLDAVLSTPFYSSEGRFSEKIEQNLLNTLDVLGPEKILLASHFPYIPFERPLKRLQRGEKLEKIIKKDPRIQIYAHGHTHRRCIADLRKEGPLILDSGPVSHIQKGSFYLYDLSKNQIEITIYAVGKSGFHPIDTVRFDWKKPPLSLDCD